MKILVIDDEQLILDTIETKLRREGFTVFTAETAEDGMRLYKQTRPDLLVVDVMLPNRSGFDLCRAIRKTNTKVPIIFLTARASEEDRIAGLELGADDYMVKPFNLSELAARVKAVLRRSSGGATVDAIESGNLSIDPKTHEATLSGKRLTLSPKEFALLYFLARSPGQVFSRDVLLDRVWGPESYVYTRTVDVHIRWLRERIEDDPAHPTRILTVRGVGYKFVG
jgi:DNA-binding response OmpR family regulator